MNTRTLTRSIGALSAVAALSLTTVACSSQDDTDTPTAGTPTATTTPDDGTDPDTGDSTGVSAQVFGPACDAVPTDGPGSFDGMVSDPVATAASNNPLLGTLVAAVTAAELGDTLNSAPALTVFAPTDDAFAAVDEQALNDLLADKDALTAVLTHHVIEGKLGPDDVVGEHQTLNGDTLAVAGDTDSMTVDGAAVLCGNIPTANATVYVVESVLMPS